MAAFTPSSRANPCPMCDRTKDGDCRILDSGIVLCHTILNGVAPGKQHPERPFVYCGHSDEAQGFGKWKPLHLCEDRTDKAPRKPGRTEFSYFFWNGEEVPVKRYRHDRPGQPADKKWAGKLNGRREIEIAPYRWEKVWPAITTGDVLFAVRGELKADMLAGRGFHAISLLNQNDEHLVTELRALVAKQITIVLVPDNDLKDLDGWYANLTAAIPQAKSLLCPLKGMDWRNPPEHGGLGIEDWLTRSQPTNNNILAAITDAPWSATALAPPPAATLATSGSEALEGDAADAIILNYWGEGWAPNDKGNLVATSLSAGSALNHLRKELPPHCLRLNVVSGLVEANGIKLEEADLETFYAEVQANGWNIRKEACKDAVLRIALKNRFDPIADYLNFVADSPDITPVDIDKLATTYIGTTNPDFDLYMKIALLGAVKRRFEPGSQFDTVVTLDGDGRIGKSAVWIALASPDWHSSSDAEQDKDFLLILHQAWIYEQAELDYLTGKQAAGKLKNLITTRRDSVRAPYGKGMEQRDRAGIMVGTVNGPFLQGDAALRGRFLVIQCPQSFARGERINIDAITRDRDAIWKAAVLACRQGAQAFLAPMQLAAASQRNLIGSEHEHPWTRPITLWLQQPINALGPHTTDEILIGSGVRSLDKLSRAAQMELAKAMEQIGHWVKDREPTRHGGRKFRFWRPSNDSAGTAIGTKS